MDYERKYKKALELATKAKNNASLSNGTLKVLDIIFPELKESEDERIRKWIIDDIRYNMNNELLNNSEYKKEAEKAIAWLEKQKSIDILDAEERVFADNVNAFREEIDNAYQKGFDEKVKTAERNKNEDSSRSDQIRDEAQKWEYHLLNEKYSFISKNIQK